MSLKIDNILKPYNGSEPWMDWFERFSTICDFNKWETEKEKARYLLVLLEGPAKRIVQQMAVTDKESISQISKRLGRAFALSPAEAHDKLCSRRIKSSETVDELYYDIIYLWRLAADIYEEDIDIPMQEKCIMPFFLKALPSSVATTLRLADPKSLSVDTFLSKARTLVASHKEAEVVGSFRRGSPNPQTSYPTNRNRKSRCNKCGDRNHTTDQCQKPGPVCFKCQQPGHISVECRAAGAAGAAGAGAPQTKNQTASKPWSGLLDGRK